MAKKFLHSYEVCKCNHVTLGEIIYTIKEKNAKNLGDIAKLTDAGTTCQCCQSEDKDFHEEKMELYLTQITKKFIK